MYGVLAVCATIVIVALVVLVLAFRHYRLPRPHFRQQTREDYDANPDAPDE